MYQVEEKVRTQKVINEEAIDRFTRELGMTPKEAWEKNVHIVRDLWMIYGFRCAGCKKYITSANLKFNDFQADTRCYSCQF
jgi:hypothetical protein